MISRAGRWTQTLSAIPLQPKKKWNAWFWITFNFWWLARLINGLEPHLPPLSSQKMKCLFFDYIQLLMISWAGRWTQTLSAIPLQPKKKMKCLVLDYVQLLMIGQADQWTWTPSATPLQPKNEVLVFWLHSTSDDQLGWSMDLNPICHPSPAKKNEMLGFGLRSTSDDWPDWSMDSNPICHPSPAKKWNACFWITFNFWWLAGLVDGLEPHLPPLSNLKMKCSFLDYVQLLMIGRAGQWTLTPSTTPLQPKKWNAHFWIMFNFWWSAGLVNGLKPNLPPLSSQKMKCSFLDYVQLLMIGWVGRWTQIPSTTFLQPKKWNASF